MAAAPCLECKRRPKALPRQRCETCLLRHEPIGVQVEAARRRLAMVPPEFRQKLTKKMREQSPAGTRWCAGCQSYRDEVDFRGSKHTQCYACRSAKSHAATIERTYGLTADEYDALLRLQGGRCAICRAKPKGKRLAVDHDHKSGAVLGLLCSRCNHDLKGSAWDSLAMATALWHYMNTPPTSGDWMPPESAPQLVPAGDAVRPAERSKSDLALVSVGGRDLSGDAADAPAAAVCNLPHVIPHTRAGGEWRTFYVLPDHDPAPF